MSVPGKGRFKRFEQRFEWVLWRLRLVAILPVIMSLVSTVVACVVGTLENGNTLAAFGKVDQLDKEFMTELLGAIMSGIDLYLIGIALMIFGCVVYEPLISPIEAAREHDKWAGGLLDIRSLDQLKGKLVKVLVVALNVSAFKAMLTLPIKDGPSLAFFCLSLQLLALRGYLVTVNGSRSFP